MKAYLDIIQRVLDHGTRKSNRTGVDTMMIPFVHFEHDMQKGFPLLTTKKMSLKNIAVELNGFIQGITSKKWYQDRGCHIWDEWCNPMANKHFPGCKTPQDVRKIDDLGPLYGYQWRSFDAVYDEDDNGVLEGTDQLTTIVETLKTNPDDRRMVCSAWNPNQISRMALPPCHYAWTLVHINGTLNLGFKMRSVDCGLGLPYNIASYALLLLLLCKEADMKPGKLSAMLDDCHIYINHIDKLKEQLQRHPKPLPIVTIPYAGWQGILKWDYRDFTLSDYTPDSKLPMPIAV